VRQHFVLTLDVDLLGLTAAEAQQAVITDIPDLKIEVLEQETGHGFGVADIITISVSIGTGITSDVAADYIRNGIKAIIRRVKGSSSEGDGTKESITAIIERERKDENPNSGDA
jgi:hypothetical protein